MIRHLQAADDLGRLNRKMRTYTRPAVLVLDEIGYLPLDRTAANFVFQIISKRYETGPIIFTSNKSFSEWGQVFCDDVLTTAILDRVLHHCEVIPIDGPSYRLKHRHDTIGDQDTTMA
jgi:DNA replication protein DnaC